MAFLLIYVVIHAIILCSIVRAFAAGGRKPPGRAASEPWLRAVQRCDRRPEVVQSVLARRVHECVKSRLEDGFQFAVNLLLRPGAPRASGPDRADPVLGPGSAACNAVD